MWAAAVLRALGPIDWKSVRRDSMLRWMIFLPPLMALGVRWGVPAVAAWLDARFGIDFAPYRPLVASVLVMLTPSLYGTVIGFLLLDQKDDRTLAALQVTPLTPASYLLYRLGLPMVLGVVMTVVALELSGLAPVGLGDQLVAALGAAPLAPAFALFLAAFARNKVQGFALMKAAGALNWPPIVAYFVDSQWQWAFGLCPTFWPAKLYWELDRGGGGVVAALAVGWLYLGLLSWWMLRRFDRAAHRDA